MDQGHVSGFKKRKKSENLRQSAQNPENIIDGDSPSVEVLKKRLTLSKRIEHKIISSKSTKKDLIVDYRSAEDIEFDRATKEAEIDTPYDHDAQAVFERQAEINKEFEGKADDGVYRGQLAYTKYLEKKDSILGKASSNLVRQGPYRASSNIRVTTRWDFEPNLCKDYKDTGFCGFGDSCKFVHDRTDYKAGWELERDYEAGLLKQVETNPYEILTSEEEEEKEYNCSICKNPFTNAVKTKCNHAFCETCALENYKKDPKCFICGAFTNGIFINDRTKSFSSNIINETPETIVNEVSNVCDSSGVSEVSENSDNNP